MIKNIRKSASNLDRVVMIRTDNSVDRIAGVHYKPVVCGTVHVLGIIGDDMRRVRHRQTRQLRVQIAVGVLLQGEYDKMRFTCGLKNKKTSYILLRTTIAISMHGNIGFQLYLTTYAKLSNKKK